MKTLEAATQAGLLTLPALVSGSRYCWGLEPAESRTLPCWEKQGPWRSQPVSGWPRQRQWPDELVRPLYLWADLTNVQDLGDCGFRKSGLCPCIPQLQKNRNQTKQITKNSFGMTGCYKV